jgi:DNA mismatch repair protein MutS2
MSLERYWGVGPKTRALLEAELGADAAGRAIETGDVRTLVDAGLERSRATRVVRRASGGAGLDLLATRDARAVYRDLIDLAAGFAVGEAAADAVRTLTPLTDVAAMADRLDAVERGRETWTGMDEATRAATLSAFETLDESDDRRLGAAETAVALQEAGVEGVTFGPVLDLDADALAAAATALRALDGGGVAEGADEELDRLRAARGRVEDMAAAPGALVEDITDGVRDTAGFQAALVDRVVAETDLEPARVRPAMAEDARDATAFVTESLRALADDLATAAEERAETVRADLASDLEDAEATLDSAERAVSTAARELSLGRFAAAYDLTRPTFVDGDALAVRDARNLTLAAADDAVQPVTYALGDHGVGGDPVPPTGDRVSVLTGANSGGKTTLLETLCQVLVLAHMGLPVPAAAAEVSPVDRVVFHRRHASFNAGVLESTLQSVVPPLTAGERTVMLVDEFEAITEPGRAADLLHGLVNLTVEQGALGTFVTHLADDLEPLPDAARTDGIDAEGLTEDLELEVDYQPRFEQVGRSTPEFIVSRLVADADDRAARAGFRTLAESVGTEAVQRTLDDVDWGGG